MTRKRYTWFIKTVACILSIILVVPFSASAVATDTIAPRASDYLASYTSYICHMGGGELQIWFRVTGTGPDWADIGALSIQLYESTDQVNWMWVDTFQHYDYDTMLAHDTYHHISCVEYQGRLCKYYRAYVCIWAGDENNNGDARYFWTDVEYASPLNP